jgi:hypothetical protein
MTQKAARRQQFALMTVDEIFDAWEKSARAGLRQGLKYASTIFAPKGRIVRSYKRAIARRRADSRHPFNAADYRNSNRVARDLGRICSIIAADAPDHVVSLDVFERAAELAKVHTACPVPAVAGGGTWCDTH